MATHLKLIKVGLWLLVIGLVIGLMVKELPFLLGFVTAITRDPKTGKMVGYFPSMTVFWVKVVATGICVSLLVWLRKR